MTYRVAVSRCRSCRGKGTVKLPWKHPRPVCGVFTYNAYNDSWTSITLALAVQQPCRPCDGTGKIHQWERR